MPLGGGRQNGLLGFPSDIQCGALYSISAHNLHMRLTLRMFTVAATINALVYGALAAPPIWATRPGVQVTTHHVIHISVDGMGASYIASLITSGEAPNFKRLRDEGASTMNARTDYDYSITLPNHTGMLTGRPLLNQTVFAAQTPHGWTSNDNLLPCHTLHNVPCEPIVAEKVQSSSVAIHSYLELVDAG